MSSSITELNKPNNLAVRLVMECKWAILKVRI
jgi:hypothetical protein